MIARKINIVAIVGLLVNETGFAGSTTGGGGPPAREKFLEQLLLAESGAGGLYEIDSGRLGLGIKGELSPDLRVITRANPGLGIPLSDIDFSSLKAIRGNIDVESIPAEISQDPVTGLPSTLRSSYRIEDGSTLDTLILTDRRTLIRNGVGNTVVPSAN
jgi:hypothetical protein